ncbi:MAG: hypothetical protein U0Y68_15105 [Blastocatellia bacterium]
MRKPSVIHCLVPLLLLLATLQAQSRQDKPLARKLPPQEKGPSDFLSSEMRSGGKVVKGSPYSADTITESLQTLANGTKLTQKTTARVYRDSEGRTRREQSAATVGPFGAAGTTPQMIFINDPIAGVAYTLYPATRTGYKVAIPPATVIIEPGDKPASEGGRPRPPKSRKEGQDNNRPKPKPDGAAQIEHPSFIPDNAKSESRVESLGKRQIEGFNADGERTTIVIPINQIGNDQPIEIVEERWKSPELRTTIWSKTSDPRWGETTYKLLNINRVEADRALFTVPSDYTIEERRPESGKPRAPRK